MENNYLIYKIINPSGKFYIGVTNNLNRRMNEHKSDWLNRTQKIALHNSFSKYGFENHIFEIWYDKLFKDEAYQLEFELVKKYKTTNSKIGLNSRDGGQGGNMINWSSEYGKSLRKKMKEKIDQKYDDNWRSLKPIILILKDTHTYNEISEIINKSTSALSFFLKRHNIKISRKAKYNLNEIGTEIKKYLDNGLTNKQIKELTGYSKGTLCRAKKLILNKES